MGHADPRQAIVDHLTRSPGDPVSVSAPALGSWRSMISEVGGFNADPTTLRFVKERTAPGRQLHFVTFSEHAGRSHSALVGVEQDAEGSWEVHGYAGGSGNGPERDRPWLNFAGWGWPRFLCGGGRVIGAGSEAAARVRLHLRDGVVVEDSVDREIVLFMVDRPIDFPVTVEIVDRAGSPLSSQRVP